MHIRAQNAALIVRRLTTADFVQFEVFEVLPPISAVMSAEGRLLCSYPGPAVQIPADIFMDECFLRELSSFLVQMDVDRLDHTSTTDSADDDNSYDSAHPRYISELLVGILRGYGQPAAVDRITKRFGDGVLLGTPNEPRKDMRWWDKLRRWLDLILWTRLEDKRWQRKPWRRSPLWLILRVSLHSSLRAGNLYKAFILFFHAQLLHTCVQRDFPSELLYVMMVKTSRRLSKLGPDASHHVQQFVHGTAEMAKAILSKRWDAFQGVGSIRPTLQLDAIDFVADSHISLDNSYEFLAKMLRSSSRGSSRMQFAPSHEFRLHNVHDFTQFSNGKLTKAITKDQRIATTDFELSVENNLESWIATSANNEDTSIVIASCIEQYFAGAKRLYDANAEDSSLMILTIMDLWVALDRFAIQECPLLKEYSPEIPSEFLHCLLLHRTTALKRALRIEEYLRRRHEEALDVPSVFSNTVSDSSFAVKCFRASRKHQDLYDKIEAHGWKQRAAKRAELASLNQKSESSLARASKMDHEESKDGLGRRVHSTTCQRCQLEEQAKNLKIGVHEWPLPPTTVHAQWVVFELSPPRPFSAWRNITYTILHDIGLPLGSDSWFVEPGTLLEPSLRFKPWAVWHLRFHRVTIASTASQFVNQNVTIPADESSIFVDNGQSFMLFDRQATSRVVESFSETCQAKFCTFPIPKTSPYNRLHRFVSGTQHTPNDIVAAQAHCPDKISLHEFIASSSLRCGPRLQWLNIARELASPSLSFRCEEVHTLITQAAWQLGPLSNGVREWHIDLNNSSFGKALLRELECLLEKNKANWQEEVTVRTIGASRSFDPHSYLIYPQLSSAVDFWLQQWTRMTFLGARVRYCGGLEM